ASFPSKGLGIELQIAAEKDTPIILCFRDFGSNRMAPVSYVNPDHTKHQLQIGEGFVSLMALGISTIFRVIQYHSTEDGKAKILAAVDLLDRK
ncbi:hypothetical protein, partial [Vineibacter terrae]|uniref:hypothetical protein n=1 Tax=Vineibacter terrae TaxID=2586908 RepID=UPI002E373106